MSAPFVTGRRPRRERCGRRGAFLAGGLAAALALVGSLAGDPGAVRRVRSDPGAVALLRAAADAARRVPYEGGGSSPPGAATGT